jgi:hypothetical protein
VRALYTSNDLTPLFAAQASRLRLHLESRDSPQASKLSTAARAVFAETNLCGGRCFYQDGRFFSSGRGACWHAMEYELETGTIRANLGGQYLQSGQAVISNIVRPVLQSFILPFHGLKTLHGAVVTKNGQTIFLAGAGGAGKTTTALAFANAGYELLSDDGPLFTLHADRAVVLSSLDYLHLTEQSLGLFENLRRYVVGGKDARHKFAIPLRQLQRSDAWQRPHQITRFIQLGRDRRVARPQLRSVDKKLVLQELFNDSMVIFRREPFRGKPLFNSYSEFIFDLVVKVIQDAEVCRLEFADEHLHALPSLLERN